MDSSLHKDKSVVISNDDMSSVGADEKPRKRRTKSGCLTCRRRRIKCDEAKPDCKNCIKAKKHCEQAPLPPNLHRKRSVSGKSTIGAEGFQPSHTKTQARGRSNPTDAEPVDLTPIRYSHSHASSQSLASRPSPTGHEWSQSPTIPTAQADITALSEVFYPHSSAASSVSRDVLGGQSFPAPILLADSTTPALAFEQMALVSPMIPQTETQHYPFSDSSTMPSNPLLVNVASEYQNHTKQRDRLGSRSYASRSVAVQTRQQFALKSGLDFRIYKSNYGEALSPRQEHYLTHFIQNVNMNFIVTSETVATLSNTFAIAESNFFTIIVPSMALQSEALLHAVIAIAVLHEANMQRNSKHAALEDYQKAIELLSQSLANASTVDDDSLLVTCLILAYFETMSGHVVSWGRHLQGSCDFVRKHIMARHSTKQSGHHQFTAEPAVVDHLIWFHIHQDTTQAILSGNGLFLELRYIQMCPLRGAPGSIMHISDQLRVLVARIGDFVAVDRRRKEQGGSTQEAPLSATHRWEALLTDLNSWRAELGAPFRSSAPSHRATPFGAILRFAHPAIASIQALSLASMLYLYRAHPTFSPVPAEAMRSAATTTHLLEEDIINIVSGIMLEGANDVTIDRGAHMRAMISAVLPVFLAGITVRDTEKRLFLEHLVKDIYAQTGWRTAIRVLQGFDVAWGRQPRSEEGLELMTHGPSGLEHDYDAEANLSKPIRYAQLDKAETMSVASGVLGRLRHKEAQKTTRSAAKQQQQQQQKWAQGDWIGGTKDGAVNEHIEWPSQCYEQDQNAWPL